MAACRVDSQKRKKLRHVPSPEFCSPVAAAPAPLQKHRQSTSSQSYSAIWLTYSARFNSSDNNAGLHNHISGLFWPFSYMYLMRSFMLSYWCSSSRLASSNCIWAWSISSSLKGNPVSQLFQLLCQRRQTAVQLLHISCRICL